MSLDALAIRSILIVLVGLTIATLLKGRAAATRHLVYAATLTSLIFLPVLRQWTPARALAVGNLPAPIRNFAARVDASPLTAVTVPSAHGNHPAGNHMHLIAISLVALWAVGCLLIIARLVAGVILAARLVKRSRRLRLDGCEAYEIRVARGVQAPSMTWIGRPVILLPVEYETWSQERIRSVVLHEAAHIARRDWLVQVIGRVACALYWPNPLVWLANRLMVDLAEQAADDIVLQTGVTPSHYAEDLLQIARTVRTNQPALTIPMALKSDVGRRIEMVLDTTKRCGSVRLSGLALAAMGAAAVAVPAASLVLHWSGEQSTIQYADLTSGKTVSGSEANGYVARLADGRYVELLQVSWHLPSGIVQAWKPDGTPIAPTAQIARQYSGPDEKDRLEFVYRLKGKGAVIRAGMDLAPEVKPTDGGEFVSDGWGMPQGADGNTLVVCDTAISPRGSSNPASFVFFVADGAAMTAASYNPATGRIVENADFPQGLTVDPEAVAHPFKLVPGGASIREDVPATSVSYNYPTGPISYTTTAIGYAVSGQAVKANALGSKRSKDGALRVTDWFPRSANLAKLEVQLHDLHAVEMQDVHLRPNTLASQ